MLQEVGLSWCKVCPNFLGCCFSVHIVLLKNLVSAISSIIIFVICRSAKKYAHSEVHKEHAEANVLCV